MDSDEGRRSKSKELKATQSREEEEKSDRNLLKVAEEDKKKIVPQNTRSNKT